MMSQTSKGQCKGLWVKLSPKQLRMVLQFHFLTSQKTSGFQHGCRGRFKGLSGVSGTCSPCQDHVLRHTSDVLATEACATQSKTVQPTAILDV